ncbi:hypothetical protein [Niabella sp.]|uniref:hypothetical protein n=1 Tax=Niabella sp. TaxID=1962976 RepID=UPI002607EA6F|nr:hypothetical protein [Niabella sp.]
MKNEGALRSANQKMLASGDNTTYGYELYDLDHTTGSVSGPNAYNKIPDDNAGALALGVNTANYLYYITPNETYNGFNVYSTNTSGGYQPGTSQLVATDLGTNAYDGPAMAVDRSDKAWFLTNTPEYDADFNTTGFMVQAYSFQTNGSGNVSGFASNGNIQARDLRYATVQDICFDNNDNMYLLVANGSPASWYSYATTLDDVTYYIYKLTAAQLADLATGTTVSMQRLGQITRADGTPVTGSPYGVPYYNYPAGESLLAGLALTATGRLLVQATESPEEHSFGQYVWELAPSGNNLVITHTSTTDLQTNSDNDMYSFYAGDLATNIFDVPLPVKFGNIEGRLMGSQVELNWISETETDNNYFEVQAARNGTDFNIIGDRVYSKAPNGTSGAPLHYNFSYTIKDQPGMTGMYGWGSGLFTLLLAFSFFVPGQKKTSHIWFPGIVFLLAGTTGISCQKKANPEMDQTFNNKYYIRIAQVDKNGKKDFSKVISIHNESE